MTWVDTVMSSQLTPITLCLSSIALIVTAFARGWVVSKFQVETLLSIQNLRIDEANKRADDYKTAWELSEKRAEVLQSLVDQLAVVGVSVNKILTALPAPRTGDNDKVGA